MDGYARFAGYVGRRPVEVVDLRTDPGRLRDGGVWFVVADFDGPARAWRFDEIDAPGPEDERDWHGPASGDWTSSLDRDEYVAAVRSVRERIRDGEVYQANVCRIVSALLGDAHREPDPRALARVLAEGNPAPYQGLVHVPTGGGLEPVWVVTASPELFLRVDGLTGSGPATITSGPIKGTAPTTEGLTAKDEAENVMITDLVRNDLQRLCEPGSVAVTGLLDVEEHPGLVHLVSTVTGRLHPEVVAAPDLWRRILEATFPPASVSGAPKSSALRIIAELETAPRRAYCGAVGWIDADAGRAELAVGIRTFEWCAEATGGVLRFGTGAGITWGSDPEGEWAETELKAKRLISLASRAHWGT